MIDTNILGSLELETAHAGVRLIVVMGHTCCKAIKAACDGAAEANLQHLLASIAPAVEAIKRAEGENFDSENQLCLDAIAKQNVLNQMQNITEHSTTIHQLVVDNKVEITGAMHDLNTGRVVFFDENSKT